MTHLRAAVFGCCLVALVGRPGVCLDSLPGQPRAANASSADSPGFGIPEDRLPSWLKLEVVLRGRLEGDTGFKASPGPDEAYYLHRLRLDIIVEPTPWFRFYVEGQDARVGGHSQPAPSNMSDSMDLRQGYIEFGRPDETPWTFRAGRQELRFGEARLIGLSNWSNVARSYDALRLNYKSSGAELDWFAASVVETPDGRFDRPLLRNGVYGFYSSFDQLIRKSVIEPYLFWKTNSTVRSEAGRPGDQDVYTLGMRAAGALPKLFDYSVETALQMGHYSQDRIRAWAGHWNLGWTWAGAVWTPRLFGEYNYASGDGNPHDGIHQNFDRLYPTNHDKYGYADRATWRNIENLAGGVELQPTRKWKWTLAYHRFWLATRQDGLYVDSGAPVVLNRHAPSRYVGSEIDVQTLYQCTARMQWEFGYAHLFAGPYLRASQRARGATYPYVMWSYRL